MIPASSILDSGQDWQVTYELWRHPLAPESPTQRTHTFLQPISCRIPFPRPEDVNWVSGTSGWREGVTAPPLDLLVPVLAEAAAQATRRAHVDDDNLRRELDELIQRWKIRLRQLKRSNDSFTLTGSRMR